MSGSRSLRGGCHCGRNRYVIAIPDDDVDKAQVLFNTENAHHLHYGTPLAAYIRVPLSWYSSYTVAALPDETHSMIRRGYTHPDQQHSKHQFCGFCGTSLSRWSEEPPTEADYIHLTLGTLSREDLADLEDLGLLSDGAGSEEELDEEEEEEESAAFKSGEGAKDQTGTLSSRVIGAPVRQTFGTPWFDSMIQESRLGRMHRRHGKHQSKDGSVKVEWEIVEFTSGEGDDDVEMTSVSSAKRKRGDEVKP